MHQEREGTLQIVEATLFSKYYERTVRAVEYSTEQYSRTGNTKHVSICLKSIKYVLLRITRCCEAEGATLRTWRL